MNKMIFAFGLVGILGIFNLGCSSKDCVSQCEAYNACEGVTKINCTDSCAPSKLEEAGVCVAEADAVESCGVAKADVCDTKDTSCNDEVTALVKCGTDYCADAANAGKDECKI